MASNDSGFKVGETVGNVQNKAVEIGQGAQDQAAKAYEATKAKAAEATKSAEAGKQSTEPNAVQKAGQQIKDSTLGAVDAVKNTLGLGPK